MPLLIEAEGLVRSFGDLRAVDGMSLHIAGGEIYGLLGPDGAGKTTTIRLLCGALEPEAGTISLGGYDMATQTEQARAQIGYLAQRFSLYGDLTVRENLHFFAEVRGLPRSEWESRSEEILAFVELDDFADRRADALSGGMKQKLGLATALVHRPQILLLDEPTGGVDPVTRQSFWQLLVRLLRQGVAVLITTPYMDEAARCSRIGFMESGKLLLEGTPGSVSQRLNERILELVGGPRRLIEEVGRDDPDVEGVQTYGDRFHLRVASGRLKQVQARMKKQVKDRGGKIERLEAIPPTLEDVFIAQIDAQQAALAAEAEDGGE
ncbi:MAG: ABC transporter ATP-binding protein [Anaerolineales bacterium]|jgi:ABC-2 type transport system ATP-binding protein